MRTPKTAQTPKPAPSQPSYTEHLRAIDSQLHELRQSLRASETTVTLILRFLATLKPELFQSNVSAPDEARVQRVLDAALSATTPPPSSFEAVDEALADYGLDVGVRVPGTTQIVHFQKAPDFEGRPTFIRYVTDTFFGDCPDVVFDITDEDDSEEEPLVEGHQVLVQSIRPVAFVHGGI